MVIASEIPTILTKTNLAVSFPIPPSLSIMTRPDLPSGHFPETFFVSKIRKTPFFIQCVGII